VRAALSSGGVSKVEGAPLIRTRVFFLSVGLAAAALLATAGAVAQTCSPTCKDPTTIFGLDGYTVTLSSTPFVFPTAGPEGIALDGFVSFLDEFDHPPAGPDFFLLQATPSGTNGLYSAIGTGYLGSSSGGWAFFDYTDTEDDLETNVTRLGGLYATFTAAPEISTTSAMSGLTLLLGGLAALRGRRPVQRAA
jgi:hypothetical protein